MPDSVLWASFFDVSLIMSELHINTSVGNLAEIGSGYGTFTLPAASMITGNLYAFDIEEEMISSLKNELAKNRINNVIALQRDVIAETTCLPDNSVDYVMLFNILHHESPADLLNEAFRILKPRGMTGILHWRSDIKTPRGPSLAIRPTPNQILQWIDKKQFNIYKPPMILKPYHFGMIIAKI